MGTIATAVTPPNAIVVAQIAYMERYKNEINDKKIWKENNKPSKTKNKKARFNKRTEKATRFSKGKNTKVKGWEDKNV